MPLYEYERKDGTRFEHLQSIHDDALKVCLTTGQPVQRVMHAPAIKFIGPGFHNNDYPKPDQG